MIEIQPGTADHKLTWHFLHSDLALHIGKRQLNSTQVLQTRISPKFFYIQV